jgi:hypothetical protein
MAGSASIEENERKEHHLIFYTYKKTGVVAFFLKA